jgi:hypothetical protein
MREIRTYGLMRGRWPVRLARRAGVYSTMNRSNRVGPFAQKTVWSRPRTRETAKCREGAESGVG